MSCEYYIPNTEELDYVGTKELKVQSLDLLWSLRLFVTGQGWRVARYLDPESAFPVGRTLKVPPKRTLI